MRAWQFSSASSETFGNSAIPSLKPEYKTGTRARSPDWHLHIDPEHWVDNWIPIILALIPEPQDRDKQAQN